MKFNYAWRIMLVVLGISWGAARMQGVYDVLIIAAFILFLTSLIYDVARLFPDKEKTK